MDRAQLATAADVSRFIHAGNATFTLQSAKTEAHFTYRVRRAKDSEREFVSLLTGPSNETDFNYIGVLTEGGLRLTAKSKATEDTPAVRAFRYLERGLAADRVPPNLHVYHEGRCGRCGRKLTVPESIENGLGPECAGKV